MTQAPATPELETTARDLRTGANRWGWLGAAGLAFGVFGAAWASAGEPTGAASLLAALGANRGAAPASLEALEEAEATAPTTETLRALVLAYLDRDQPGLAQAALDHMPLDLRYTPEAQHLEARVLLRRGRARMALAAARTAAEGCERASRGEAAGACPAHLAARTSLQIGYLEELVAAGVDDPEASPEATRAAWERRDRSARLVALR